jgi:hypothetical protein
VDSACQEIEQLKAAREEYRQKQDAVALDAQRLIKLERAAAVAARVGTGGPSSVRRVEPLEGE